MSLLSGVFRAAFVRPSLSIVALLSGSLFAAVDIRGEVLWDDLRLDTEPSRTVCETPMVVADSAGSYAVLWKENDRIVGRAFKQDGTPLGQEKTLLYSGNVIGLWTVSPVGSGVFGIAWVTRERKTVSQGTMDIDVIKLQRFQLADLAALDASPFDGTDFDNYRGDVHNLILQIDESNRLICAYRETSPEDIDYLRIRVFNAAGQFMASWNMNGPERDELSIKSLVYFGNGRFVLLTNLWYLGPETQELRARFFELQGTSLDATTGFITVHDFGPVGLAYDGPACAAPLPPAQGDAFRTVWINFGGEPVFAKTCTRDGTISDARVIEPERGISYSLVMVAANRAGDESLVAEASERTGSTFGYSVYLWPKSRTSSFFGEKIRIGKGQTPFAAIDKLGRTTVTWNCDGDVYLKRIGPDSLFARRINRLDSDPVIASCGLAPGAKLAAWVRKSLDSLVVAGWLTKNGVQHTTAPDWIKRIPAGCGSFAPRLVVRDSIAGTVSLSPQSSTDTSLAFWLVRVKTGDLARRTVNNNGTSASFPDIAADSTGFAVVWQDRRAAHSDTPYVYLQIFNADGTTPGGNIALSTGSRPKIVAAGGGRFLIAFQYVTTTTSIVGGVPVVRVRSNVFAMIVNSQGTIVKEPFRLNENADIASEPLAVRPFSNGRTLLFWKETDSRLNTRILYKALDSDGNGVGAARLFSAADSAVGDIAADVINDTLCALAWFDRQRNAVHLQCFSSAGNPSGTPLLVSNRPVASDIGVSLSLAAGRGMAFVSWIDGTERGTSYHRLIADLYSFVPAVAVVHEPPRPRIATAGIVPSAIDPAGPRYFDLRGRAIAPQRVRSGLYAGVVLAQRRGGAIERIVGAGTAERKKR